MEERHSTIISRLSTLFLRLRSVQYSGMPADMDESEQDYEAEGAEGSPYLHAAYRKARRNFEEFIGRIEPLGFLSQEEISSQRRYIESAENDPGKMIDVSQSYSRDMIGRSISKNYDVYHNHLIKPLDEALEGGIISAKSYREWIAWMRDSHRSSMSKKASIESTLPSYLSARRRLHHDRVQLLRDPRLRKLESETDMDKKIARLRDTDGFLTGLTFEERKSLIREITAALPLAGEEEKLFKKFEGELGAAVGAKLINGASRDKWIARFKRPGLSIKAKEYFITYQWPSYRKGWEKVKDERAKLTGNPLFAKLDAKDCKEIAAIKDEGKFLDLHFDKKTSLLAEARAAMEAKKNGKETLMRDARGILAAAAAAGYISAYKVGPWLEHVISGKRTIHELKGFIGDWAKVRYGFDKVQRAMNQGKVPQGLTRLSEEKFLNLSYEQRKSYVEEASHRLSMEKDTETKDTPIKDLKGKVRHALDTENWEEADYFLRKAWKVASNDEDIREIQSMERYLASFAPKRAAKNERQKGADEIRGAYKEIELVLGMLPKPLVEMYKKALLRGAGCLQCVTTTIYNRTWCQDRGYLTEAKEEHLKELSRAETAERMRPGGGGHSDGLENQDLTGFGQPSIRDKGIGPQNVFMNSDRASSFVDEADKNKETWSFWYWTNLVVEGVSASENAYVARNLNWRIKRAARTLERHGLRYSEAGLPASAVPAGQGAEFAMAA